MRKSAPLVQVKAGPTDGLAEGQFTGYASVFGNKDSYGDIVQPGAFKDTLAEWDASADNLPVLWGHDMADPFSNIGIVNVAEEDEKGLKVTAQLDLENPKAMQVYRLLKSRAVAQMSFAYDVLEGKEVKSEGEDSGGYYSLDKLKLYEVSIVPIGANQETEILAVKMAREIASKAGRVISATNEKSLRTALQSLEDSSTQIKNVLTALDGPEGDQEKARAEEPPQSAEEPPGAKSDAPASKSPVSALAAQATIYALKGAERGSQ